MYHSERALGWGISEAYGFGHLYTWSERSGDLA